MIPEKTKLYSVVTYADALPFLADPLASHSFTCWLSITTCLVLS
jgi:hypothetical protein